MGLSDRQAAEAVRGRIDWKYLLGLELEDAGFDPKMMKACWEQNKVIRPEMDWGRSSSSVYSTNT